jgi:predicted DNA-binding transcriptional regulator AlpA
MGDKLRTRAAARYTGLSARTLASRGWRLKHGLPTIRIGRALVFDSAALDRWLAKHAERRLHEEAE